MSWVLKIDVVLRRKDGWEGVIYLFFFPSSLLREGFGCFLNWSC